MSWSAAGYGYPLARLIYSFPHAVGNLRRRWLDRMWVCRFSAITPDYNRGVMSCLQLCMYVAAMHSVNEQYPGLVCVCVSLSSVCASFADCPTTIAA